MRQRAILAGLSLLIGGAGCTSGPDRTQPDGGGDGRGEEPAVTIDAGSGATGDGCLLPPAPPARQAFFTRGLPDGDLTIEDQLVHLIDAADPDSRIRGAFAYLDQTRVADALIDAAARGVDVGIVVDERNQVAKGDGWSWNPAIGRLQAELGDRLVICGGADRPADEAGGCIGKAKQHSSFLVVSSTCDGAELVVAQTSAYLTKGQLGQRNNLVIVRGDQGLFEAYRGYWDDLARQRRNDSYYRVVDGDSGTRLFLFPRAPEADQGEPAATDTVYRLLRDQVDCAAGAGVKIAMAYWTSSRPALIDELVRLQEAGCAIDLVVDPEKTEDEVEAALAEAFAPDHLRFLAGVHHKLVLVDGVYAGSARRLVWTGTQDFTLAALRDNDETILRIEDDGIHDDFDRAFAELFADGAATAEGMP